jgi:hypothetical protein
MPADNALTGSANDDNSYDKVEAARLQRQPITQAATTAAVNAGTTQAGKAATQFANVSRQAPNKRLYNPLGNFSSYTYNIALFMVTPEAYDAFILSGRKNINALNSGGGTYLVAQSGGINNQNSTRLPGVKLDYYIDNLKITSKISGKTTGTNSNITAVNFSIYEPYGFSFITKLRQAGDAIQSSVKGKKLPQNPSRQFFIIRIGFLGYDADGKLITGKETFAQDTFDPSGSSHGVFERFYDISINSIKFKIDGRATTYNITAARIPSKEAYGTKRGFINTNTKVIATTVDDALMGPDGLIAKLNKDQSLLSTVEKNVYSIRYVGDSTLIKTASIISKADLDKSKMEMGGAKNTKDVNPTLEVTTVPNVNKRQIVFKDATPMLQAISQIISQSSYLEDALKVVYTNNLEPDSNNPSDDTITPPTNKTISWYNVAAEVTNPRWDSVSGDFAYNITYVIQPYQTPVVVGSAYVKKVSKYYGPHKRYDYWYTGKNSEILQYEQTLDNTYYNVAINPVPLPLKGDDGTSQGGDADIPVIAGQRQPGPRLGKLDDGMEAQNSYITSLLDPKSFASAKVTILGDPDFLINEAPGGINQVYNQFYGGDGFTINPNGGQVFIEINFYEVEDYDNNTGKININDRILFFKYPASIQKEINSRGGGISYMLLQVDSSFNGGKFTQILDLNTATFADDSSDAASTGEGRTADIGELGYNTALPNISPTVAATPVASTGFLKSAVTSVGNAIGRFTSTITTNFNALQNAPASTQLTTATGDALNPYVASDDGQSSNTTYAPAEGGREF